MIREWLARRSLALERFNRLRLGCRILGRQLVLGRCRLQLFELKFHLLQQPRLTLRAIAVKLAPQLLDLQLEMGDHSFRAGVHRLGASRNGLGFHAGGALGQACGAFGQDHRMGNGKIGWQRFNRRCHTARESYSSATSKQNCHPTELGRHVSCGLRQSIPESR